MSILKKVLLVLVIGIGGFLAFAATGRFHISHGKLGPTEFRLALVLINALAAVYGTRLMGKALPFVALGGFVVLCLLVYKTQRELWQRDMEHKRHAERARAVLFERKEAA